MFDGSQSVQLKLLSHVLVFRGGVQYSYTVDLKIGCILDEQQSDMRAVLRRVFVFTAAALDEYLFPLGFFFVL